MTGWIGVLGLVVIVNHQVLLAITHSNVATPERDKNASAYSQFSRHNFNE
jgi:hypothetical protein